MKKIAIVFCIASLCFMTGFRNPPGALRYMELGDKALSERNPSAALEFYTKGIRLEPGNPSHYLKRAFLNMKLDRLEESLQDFNSYIKLDPSSPQGYMSRGMLLGKLGREKEARDDFRQACRLGDSSGCDFDDPEKK